MASISETTLLTAYSYASMQFDDIINLTSKVLVFNF